MADKTYEQELADIENQLGLPIPGEQKAKLIARKEEILKNPQYRYEKAHGLPTAKAPDATSIQEANTNYEDLANKNLGILNNTPQAPKDNLNNVNDTKAIGATKEELDDMLEKGEISRAAYEKQIASLHTSDEQEKAAKGVALADEGKPDSTDRPDNFQLGNKVAEEAGIDTTPSKEDTPKEKEAKKRYNKATMSIWDAYNEGIIDKETAGYFTIDALATLASNLGRRIGNVGAQFSGGTIDNNQDTSAWEQRKNAILGEEIQSEKEAIGGQAGRKAASEEASIESQELANARTRIQNEYTAPQLELALKSLENELTAQGLNINLMESRQDIIDTLKSDPDYHNSAIKQLVVGYLAQSGAAGAVNTGGNVLGNILSFALK